MLLFDAEVEGHMEGGFESPTLYSALRECLDCGVIRLGADGHIVSANAAAERILARSHKSLLNPAAGVLPEPVFALVREAMEKRTDIAGRDVEFSCDVGAPSALRVTVSLTLGENTSVSEVILVLHDLTGALSLDRSMRWLDRLASIGTLSASMAHEVKNAMVSVGTFAGLLLKKNQDAELADLVGREIHRIDSIVSQMLRFAGPAKPTFAPIHLHDILNHALALMQHQLKGKRIHLDCALRATNDLVKGDAYQLEQAFINLFFNALEAMGPGGRLGVSTEMSPATNPDGASMIRAIISDTGVGIPEANLERLFQPFFTTKPSGTGLGLPITRRIVLEHRGVVAVRSELNQGASFSVDLPVVGG